MITSTLFLSLATANFVNIVSGSYSSSVLCDPSCAGKPPHFDSWTGFLIICCPVKTSGKKRAELKPLVVPKEAARKAKPAEPIPAKNGSITKPTRFTVGRGATSAKKRMLPSLPDQLRTEPKPVNPLSLAGGSPMFPGLGRLGSVRSKLDGAVASDQILSGAGGPQVWLVEDLKPSSAEKLLSKRHLSSWTGGLGKRTFGTSDMLLFNGGIPQVLDNRGAGNDKRAIKLGLYSKVSAFGKKRGLSVEGLPIGRILQLGVGKRGTEDEKLLLESGLGSNLAENFIGASVPQALMLKRAPKLALSFLRKTKSANPGPILADVAGSANGILGLAPSNIEKGMAVVLEPIVLPDNQVPGQEPIEVIK